MGNICMKRCNSCIDENSEVKDVSPESDTKLREQTNRLEVADTFSLVAGNTSSAQLTSAISTSRSLRLHRAVQRQEVSQACNLLLLLAGMKSCRRVSECDLNGELKRWRVTGDGKRYGLGKSIAKKRLTTAERSLARTITPERGNIVIIQWMNKL